MTLTDRVTSLAPTQETYTVLVVDIDEVALTRVRTAFERWDDLTARIETDPAFAPERLDEVDCVMYRQRPDGPDPASLLSVVRERARHLPFVLHSTASARDGDSTLLTEPLSATVIEPWSTATAAVLAQRVRLLVDQYRNERVIERFLTALDIGREDVLLADPDGTISIVSDGLVATADRSESALVGESLTGLLTEATRSRIRQTARPFDGDDWWTGTVTLRPQSLSDRPLSATIGGLDDGSTLVLLRPTGRDTAEST